MAVLALVVLLAPVLEHDELLVLEVLEHGSLHPGARDVGLAEGGRLASLGGEDALKRNLLPRLNPFERVALVVAALGDELLGAANLDDGVPRGGAGGGRGGEANLVHGG